MRANPLRTLCKSGGATVNGWLAIPDSSAAETLAHQGWDSLTTDLQHGLVDYAAMVPMLQARSTTPGDARALAGAGHPDEVARTTRRAASAASARCGRCGTAAPTTRSMPTTPSSSSR